MTKLERYDEAYFNKWYRSTRYRVKSAAELRRQASFVLSTAEWVLGGAVRTVLDVGCGEGQWGVALRSMRSSIKYEGVDPSEYAVRRYGKRRNIKLGGIENLGDVASRRSYDLIICCGMLNYLTTSQLSKGISNVAQLASGVAYLELFTSGDSFEGDTSWPTPRSRAFYRKLIGSSGLHPVGMHCYVPIGELHKVAQLERL